MDKVSIIGLDIAKEIFEVCVQDVHGKTKERHRLRRKDVLNWFERRESAKVGLEACGGAHYWAREISRRGHEIKIIPPQYVKPFVRANKDDSHDAQAICRALREPDMPSVAMADIAQQDIQALHRVRSRLVRERTALVNQARGLLLEHGIALGKRLDKARQGLNKLVQFPKSGMSHLFVTILQDHVRELHQCDEKISYYESVIEKLVREDPAGERVMEVPGVGSLSASALLVKIRHASVYENGRHFAASLGLVPRHEGTGGKVFIRGMSKRGDPYLRTLLIHGARAVISHVENKRDPFSMWIKGVVQRRGKNKAIGALANKNARIAWRVIAREERYDVHKAVHPLVEVAA
jgi:transposase